MIHRLNTFADGWMDALWNASLQGGVALLVVWCICRFVPRISPGFKVWLWRIAWFKILLAFFWSGSIDLPLLAPPSHLPVGIESAPVAPISQEVPFEAAHIEPSLNARAVLFIIWLLGVLCCVVHLGYQWIRSTRLKRRSSAVANEVLAEECSKLGIARLPALRESSGISAPVLIGILRPAILTPCRSVPDDQTRLMLAHELAHLKRRDLLWAWLPAICHTLFFFHPLLWLTRREWLLAQEIACDHLALRRSGASPAAYGNMLIDLVASPVPRPRFGTLSICETTQNLKRRILAMKTIGTRNSRGLMLAIFITTIAAVLPWRIVAQDEPRNTTSRIEHLEKENAELRAQLEKLKQAPPEPKPTSEELRVPEGTRLSGEKAARDFSQAQTAAEISAAEAELSALVSRYTDRHPKVLQAQKRLEQLKERQAAIKERRPSRTNDAASRQRDLYLEELALAQQYADSMRKQFEGGRTTHEEFFRAQQQLLRLKREIAGLDANRQALRHAVEEEIAMVERLVKEARKRVEIGTAPVGADLDLQRELLRLKRELLLLE